MAKKRPEKSLDELLEEALVKEGEEPYEVPGNWVWVKIGNVIEDVEKKDPKKEGVDKFTYLDISSINNITGKIANPKICQGYKAPSRARQVVKANDILFSTVRHYLKNIAVVDEIYNDQIASTGFCVLRSDGIIDSNLLFQFVRSDIFVDRLNGFQRGISYPAVKTSDLLKQSVLLPPAPEQKRIVKKLSSMLGKLKAARELIQEARDTFEERRAAILNKAFTGELTKKWREENPDIESAEKHLQKSYEAVKDQYEKGCLDCKSKGIRKPKQPEILRYFSEDKIRDLSEMGLNGWCETDFVNFCILQRGFDLPIKKRTRGRYPVVSSSGIIDHHIESKVKGPGFTVGRSGSVGKTYFVEEDYWPLNTTLFSKELNGNDPKYAFYCLSTFDFLKFSSSTAVPTLNRNNFSDALIKVPPLKEQKEIVRILEKLLDREDKAKAFIDMEEQIDLIEKSILSKAFRGELGTNDPDDEPAIELLERSLKEKFKAA